MLNVSLANFFLMYRDDHGFSPLHWAAKEGHLNLVTLLIQRGARVNATNMGDDTPLHLATAHGHRDIVSLVIIVAYGTVRTGTHFIFIQAVEK